MPPNNAAWKQTSAQLQRGKICNAPCPPESLEKFRAVWGGLIEMSTVFLAVLTAELLEGMIDVIEIWLLAQGQNSPNNRACNNRACTKDILASSIPVPPQDCAAWHTSLVAKLIQNITLCTFQKNLCKIIRWLTGIDATTDCVFVLINPFAKRGWLHQSWMLLFILPRLQLNSAVIWICQEGLGCDLKSIWWFLVGTVMSRILWANSCYVVTFLQFSCQFPLLGSSKGTNESLSLHGMR